MSAGGRAQKIVVQQPMTGHGPDEYARGIIWRRKGCRLCMCVRHMTVDPGDKKENTVTYTKFVSSSFPGNGGEGEAGPDPANIRQAHRRESSSSTTNRNVGGGAVGSASKVSNFYPAGES